MGGLNYQIEHHLFPSMPRPQPQARAADGARLLRRATACRYREVGLFESYGIVVDYLNNVGCRRAGPFDCPWSATFRD